LSFDKACREVDVPGGGKKKVCDPPTGGPGNPPKVSPCSEVMSCAPGVGRESGILSTPEKPLFDSLLHSDQNFKKLVGDSLESVGATKK